MKTRSVNTNTASRGAGTFAWASSPCAGSPPPYSGTQAVGPIVVDCFREEEAIDSESGRRLSHPVTHRKRTLVVNEGSGSFSHSATSPMGVTTYPTLPCENTNANSGRLVPSEDWDVGQALLGTLPPRWGYDLSSLNEKKLINDCYSKARGLKADVLLNIVEGHQVIPSFRSLITTLPQLLKSWGSIRKLVRTASGSYLAYKFGVSPFLSDVSDFWKYLPKLGKDLKKHNDGEKTHCGAKFVPIASFDDSDNVLGTTNGYSYSTIHWRGSPEKIRTIRYVLVVEPRVKRMESILSTIDFIMSRFGTGPASLAWEEIPYSFVVDWFVDLRDLLRMLDDAIIAPPYKVVSFTRSDSYILQSLASESRFSPCNGSEFYSADCGYCRYQHYVRSNVPLGHNGPSWNVRFGKNQAAILAALIAQYLTGAKKSIR